GVFLERVRCGEHDRLRASQPEPRYELPVRRDHGRAGLAGPDDRQHTYRSHRRRDLLCRFPSPGRTIHYVATITPPRAPASLPPVGLPPDAMKPGIHGVRTRWIRGFMAFQLARHARKVRLMMAEWLVSLAGLLRLAAVGDELPGGAGLQAPGRGREGG